MCCESPLAQHHSWSFDDVSERPPLQPVVPQRSGPSRTSLNGPEADIKAPLDFPIPVFFCKNDIC
jgi:hypothetical protein